MKNRRLPEPSLRDFYYVLFRQKAKIVSFFVAVVILTIAITLWMPKIYRSEAKLMVRLGRESISLDPTVTTGPILNVGQNRENEINSELEILKSRELAEKVVDTLGVEAFLTGKVIDVKGGSNNDQAQGAKSAIEKKSVLVTIWGLLTGRRSDDPMARLKLRMRLVNSLMDNLQVWAIKKSSIIAIAYEARSGELANAVVRKLIDFYLDKHIQVYRTAGSHHFFTEQTKRLGEELVQTEEAIRKLKNRIGIGSLPDQRRILLERIGSLKRELEETHSAMMASAAKVAMLRKRLKRLPKTLVTEQTVGFPQSAREQLRRRIYDLELKEQDLLSTFREDSVPVQEIRRQIREAKAILRRTKEASQVKTGVNTTFQQLQGALLAEEGGLAALKAKARALEEQLVQAQQEVRNLNDAEIQLNELQRELNIKAANYRKYAESLEQTRIDQALEMRKISNIRVVQPASFPVKPIWPKKKLNLIIGLFLGTFGGLAIAFLSEYFDHSFKRPEDVEKWLDLPVLAAIPDWEHEKIFYGVSRKEATRGERASLVKVKRVPWDVPPQLGSHYRAALDNILLSLDDGESLPRIYALTACKRGEGVSTVAFHLAATLARTNQGRVLLVDANFVNPRIHELLGEEPSPGLTDLCSGASYVSRMIRPTPLQNLNFLSSGLASTDPIDTVAFFESAEFKQLLRHWRLEFQNVIFDVPPPDGENHAVSICALVDAVILIIKAEGVRWEVALTLKERLEKVQSRIIGVVLNRRRYYIPEWIYNRI